MRIDEMVQILEIDQYLKISSMNLLNGTSQVFTSEKHIGQPIEYLVKVTGKLYLVTILPNLAYILLYNEQL